MAHWSSGLPVCFPPQGNQVQIPRGYLCETGILLLALSRYIGDPDVIDHFCGLVWGGLRPEPSLGPCADNVIIPLDLTQIFCPGFTLAVGPPSSFTTNGVGCWGGALWRACNLTSFSPCLTGPVDYLFTPLLQEAKYVERWPNTASAWAGLSRFDISVDRYGRVRSQLICTSRTLGSPTCHWASQQGNTYWAKYQKAYRASTLCTLCPYWQSNQLGCTVPPLYMYSTCI